MMVVMTPILRGQNDAMRAPRTHRMYPRCVSVKCFVPFCAAKLLQKTVKQAPLRV